MQIKVLRKVQYNKTMIYIIQFGYVFQYWFHYEDGLYQDHIEFLPSLWKRMACRLGIIKTLYSERQMSDGEEVVLSGAMKTYDTISSREYKRKNREAQRKETLLRKADKSLAKKKNNEQGCSWMTTQEKDGGYYNCLKHNVAVKMVDGQFPKH